MTGTLSTSSRVGTTMTICTSGSLIQTDQEMNRLKGRAMTIFKLLFVMLLLDAVRLQSQEVVATTLEPTYGKTLFLWSPSSTKKIYQRTGWIFDNSQIHNSPDDKHIAALLTEPVFKKASSGLGFENHELLVFSRAGEVTLSIPRVQAYDWSPDAHKLACIIGTDYEGEGFSPESLIVIRIDGTIELSRKSQRDEDISWANHDSMIYTTDMVHVFRVNPRTGARSATKYKGIFFSPNGKYYCSANYEGGTFGVYERTTNKEVTPSGYYDMPSVGYIRWLPGGSSLVFGIGLREKKVYNCELKKVTQTVEGQILGYDRLSGSFMILKDKKYYPGAAEGKIELLRVQQ